MIEDGSIVERGTYRSMMEHKQHFYKFVQGEKYKTINQIAQQMLNKLLMKLLEIKTGE